MESFLWSIIMFRVCYIEPEFSNFDLSLLETWLNNSILNQDLAFKFFQLPFRRDRICDSFCGIVVYVKNNIPSKRRNDVELISIECLWLEFNIRNRKILVGTFYRPPNSTP